MSVITNTCYMIKEKTIYISESFNLEALGQNVKVIEI